MKVGVIFGGMSTEHDVSVVSGTSVIKNLNKDKYEVYPIYIDRQGTWYEYKKEIRNIQIAKLGEELSPVEKIENIIEYLKKLDLIFPVLHGLYGEDGTIQGLFELLKIPYVGCKVLGSSVCMDKAYTNIIFEKANIKHTKYIYVRKCKDKYLYVGKDFKEETLNISNLADRVIEEIKLPVFVKPSNSGSSIGITKAKTKQEIESSIEEAAKYDKKIIIEANVQGREVECSVLGNEDVKASCIGEILPAEEFYSFDAKYKDDNSRLVIPAEISEEKSDEIRNMAIKAFKAVDGKGFARVDFFIEKDTQEVYINEINTIPGFTEISMYPKLWDKVGIKYSELLEELINLALEK